MMLRPGTFPWLLAHDLRLSRRRFLDMFRGMSATTRALVIGGAMAVFHLLAWPVAGWLARMEESGPPVELLAAMAAGTLFVLPWMLAQSLTSATRALYARGDLDLLLASPLPAGGVLASRAVAIVFETVASVLIFIAPLANMGVLLGHAHWLAIYPAVLATGALAAALGLAIAVGLFAIVGPRRTRLVAQVVATLIGATFVLGIQALTILPDSTRTGLLEAIAAAPPGSLLDPSGSLWLPVRAAMGEVAALAQWTLLSVGIFALSVATLGPRFAASVVTSANVGSRAPGDTAGSRRRNGPVRFERGIGSALRRKEWRLLTRDPWLSSQLFLQVIYTLPVSVVLWRSQSEGGAAGVAMAIAPAIVVIASQLAASLAWLAVSGEDAPEFLSSAPVGRGVIERHKLEAIALPVAALLAGPLLGLLLLSPLAGALTAIFSIGAAASTALLNLWHPMPGKRRDMMRRHSQSKLVGLMEHLLSLLWVTAMMLCWFASVWTMLPLGLALALLWFNRRLRERRDSGGDRKCGEPGLGDVAAAQSVSA